MEQSVLTSEKAQKMLNRLKEDYDRCLYIEFYHVEDMQAMVNRIKELEKMVEEMKNNE